MTDKEKIREEVVRIQLYTQSEVLKQVLDYIDSLQEEPKFKTGDRIKPIDSCLGSPRTIVDVCDSWYVTDQGTLDFEFEDNWELAEEYKKCMYSKDNYTNEDRKVLCDGCEEECKYNKKEPSIPDIVDEHFDEMLGEESIPLNVQEAAHQYIFNTPSLILPLLHDTDLRWEKVVIEELERAFTAGIKWKESQISKDTSKLT